MSRLPFLADEHVDRAFVTALRSTGFRVETSGELYDPGTPDSDLLSFASDHDLVLITNDLDFVQLAVEREHAGVIMYQQYGHSPSEFVRGISRIDRFLSRDDLRGHVEWLENWL